MATTVFFPDCLCPSSTGIKSDGYPKVGTVIYGSFPPMKTTRPFGIAWNDSRKLQTSIPFVINYKGAWNKLELVGQCSGKGGEIGEGD